MRVLFQNRVRYKPIVAAAWVILLIMIASACGGTDDAPSTSASGTTSGDSGQASSTTIGSTTASTLSLHDKIQQQQAGATTSSPDITPSTGATTTTMGASSTTVNGSSSTANSTTTTANNTATTKSTTTTVKPTTTTAKGPIVLTVTGPSGTEELSMADLKAMWATSGYGGWKNQLGNITAPVSWKGVALTNLMDLVGGGSSILVLASDGYEQPLSAGELSGAVTTYNPATGEEISSISGSITVIVAYAKGGSAIGGDEGPLRIAFVSAEKDQVTDSFRWVRMVRKITVR